MASVLRRDERVAPQQAKSSWSRLRGTHFNTFRRSIGTPSDLWAVDAFPDSQRVWVGGTGGVLAFSRNDGQDIEGAQILSAQGTRPVLFADTVNVQPAGEFSAAILDLHFETVVHGYAVDDRGGILETWTGGRTWARYQAPNAVELRTVGAVRPDYLTGDSVQVSREEIEGFPGLQAQAAEHRLSVAHWFGADAALGISGDSVLVGIPGPGGTWLPVPLPPSGADPPGTPVKALALARLDLTSALVAVALPQLRTRILRGTRAGAGWNWTAVAEPPFRVASLHAAGPGRVWAVTGGDTRVWLSTDGGAGWTESSLPHELGLHDLAFRDGVRGWAVGDHGTLLSSSDGGESWAAVSGAGDRLEAVQFLNRRKGWAVGSWGTVLYTSDGGRTWAGRGGLDRTHLRDLSVLSAGEIVVVGDRLTVRRSVNGGRTWETPLISFQSSSRGGVSIRAVQFVTRRIGWAVADSGAFLQSSDGGESWRVGGLATRENLTGVFFLSPERGWITTALGRIYTTANGGISWTLEGQAPAPLTSIHGADGAVWAAGARGTVFTRGPQGAWTAVQAPASAEFGAVVLTSRDSGWAAGSNGTLLRSTDGGRTWQTASPPTRSDLLGLASGPGGRVWAVGTSGTVLRQDPRTAAWSELATARVWWPGDLLWLGVLGGLASLLLILYAPVERSLDERTIDAVLASDEPLQPGDLAAERLLPYARTIARFLLNRSTRPPLTVAITGRWGAGKSSLMNLIRGEIEAYGRQPVQFNAWQHQKEEHLLAAFLETIRNEGLPTLLRSPLRYVAFRCRLFRTRIEAHRPAAMAALAFLAIGVGFFVAASIAGWPDQLVEGFDACTGPNECAANLVDTLADNLVTTVLGLSFIVSLVQTVRSFGALPSSVFAKLGELLRIKPAALETSVRQRFAAELQEVSRALDPDSLIVFVDDLDRCRPRPILDVLEAIHFLVNAGRCMVVIGMDWNRVVRSVALGFGEDAEAIWLPEDVQAGPGAPVAPPPAEESGKGPAGTPVAPLSLGETPRDPSGPVKRREYATQYLDKLITVTIPLPPPQKEDFAEFLRSATTSAAVPRGRVWWSSAVAPVLVASLVFVLVVWGLWSLTGESAPSGGTAGIAESAVVGQAPAGAGPGADTAAAPQEPRRRFSVYPQPRSESSLWAFVAVGVLAVAGAGAITLRALLRKPEVIRDSTAFRDAFRVWAPYLSQTYRTPRALKKFVTRVRYYAMASAVNAGPEPPPIPGGRSAGPSEAAPSVDDEVLVALAALHACDPATFRSDQTYASFAQTVADTLELDPQARASLRLPQTLTTEWREWFEKIVDGLQLQSPGSRRDVSD